MYILGVDCGGTSTKALLTNSKGLILGRGKAGPANFLLNGSKGVVTAIEVATAECFKAANLCPIISADEKLLLALGVAGAGRENEQQQIKQALEIIGFRNILINHDAHIAHLAALGGSDGVIVIAGTGSMAYGVKAGKTVRAGGWGYLLGDEGSGFAISIHALKLLLAGVDGQIDLDQALLQGALTYFQIEQLDDLFPLLYQAPLNRHFIAGFSQTIANLGEEGNFLAQVILKNAGEQLAILSLAVLKQLGLTTSPGIVAITGGVFQAGDLVITPMKDKLKENAPKQIIKPPLFEPVVGAVLLGALHQNYDLAEIRNNISRGKCR